MTNVAQIARPSRDAISSDSNRDYFSVATTWNVEDWLRVKLCTPSAFASKHTHAELNKNKY